MAWNDPNLIKILKNGGIVVMPTDTIYGIVGRAEDVSVVNRIYNLKKRTPDKPCIILIGEINDLKKFSVALSGEQKTKLAEYWPGPVSVVFDCFDEAFSYLHRGTKTLAFRFPDSKELQELLTETEPLVAPSANPEGLPPAKSIEEARNYFGDSVNLYVDGGEIDNRHSKLIKLQNDGSVVILRE